MINEEGLGIGLKELFKYAFITNCHLDGEVLTIEDTGLIDSFDFIDLLDNFKDLIVSLLKFKKDCKNKEAVETCNKEYSDSLAKTHGQDLEYYVKKTEELAFQLANSEIREENILKNYEFAIAKIQKLESKNRLAQSEWVKEKTHLQDQLNKFSQKNSSKKKVESENAKLKKLLEEKFVELEIVKRSHPVKSKKLKKSSEIEPMKKFLIGKADEPLNPQQKANEKFPSKLPFRDRLNQKSFGPSDFSSLQVSSQDFSKYSKSHNRSSSENKFA